MRNRDVGGTAAGGNGPKLVKGAVAVDRIFSDKIRVEIDEVDQSTGWADGDELGAKTSHATVGCRCGRREWREPARDRSELRDVVIEGVRAVQIFDRDAFFKCSTTPTKGGCCRNERDELQAAGGWACTGA